ncbi:M23 family metallopeptidase [Pseudonocardia sp. NPDC046786]|uniref:M23 family metallopeptidase n=1 Tax=Pseudonocardia sp. NPDC046786 TaxID=3155471 RepID=UPI0033E9965C
MAGAFPSGPHVRRARRAEDRPRYSASTRIAAAVVAVGGLAGAAHASVGGEGLPAPVTGWLGTASAAFTGGGATAGLAAPEAVPAAAPIADPGTIAALATPAAGGASVAAQTVIAGAGVHSSAADAVDGAVTSIAKVQEAAAEQARAAEAARAAGATGSLESPSVAGGAVSIVSGRVTSGFGSRWGSQHMGLDIAAPIGTPINVPIDGTVISSGAASGFGMWVRVQHDDGTITVYGHINRSLVSVGERVTAGQQIAEVGNRGQSTGPHLHIEVIDPSGTKINPKPWLDARGFSYT